MDATHTALLAVFIFGAALLYSTVGHAGASGYLAAMALFSVAPEVMRPTALALNLGVSLIASVKFIRAGRFSWPLFWPFAIASVPAAFIGGRLTLPSHAYKVVLGLVLFYAAVRMFISSRRPAPATTQRPPIGIALLVGAVIGILSGLTGVGGGIFLSPLLILMHWAETRESSGVAALFILVNSAAGLLGNYAGIALVAPSIVVWMPAAIIGGWIGAEYGSRRLAIPVLRQCLAAVLVVAGFKLMIT